MNSPEAPRSPDQYAAPVEVKTALDTRAAETGQPISEITAALLLEALKP